MSKSIFHELGYDAEKAFMLELKSKVLTRILESVKKSKLTQHELSKLLDQPQPRVSELLNGKLSLLSLEKLLEYYRKLGGKVDIELSKAPKLPKAV